MTPLVEKILTASVTPRNGPPPASESARRPAATEPTPTEGQSRVVGAAAEGTSSAGYTWTGGSLATYGQTSTDTETRLRWVVAAVVVAVAVILGFLLYIFS